MNAPSSNYQINIFFRNLYNKIYHLKGKERVDNEIDHFKLLGPWGWGGEKKVQEDNDNYVQMKHETKLVQINRWSRKSG